MISYLQLLLILLIYSWKEQYFVRGQQAQSIPMELAAIRVESPQEQNQTLAENRQWFWPPGKPADLFALLTHQAPHPWIPHEIITLANTSQHHGHLSSSISQQCLDELHSATFYKHMIPAYAEFARNNQFCIKDKVSPCWDPVYRKWAQGQCKVNCNNRMDKLAEACRQANGELCMGNYYAGISGTTLEFSIPTCNPRNCTSHADNDRINVALMNATCDNLPSVFLTECLVEQKCFKDNDLAIHVMIYLSLTLIIALFLVFLFFRLGLTRFLSSPSSNNYKFGKVLLRRSDSLRESIFSPLIGVDRTEETSFSIVEGTPRPIDDIRDSIPVEPIFTLEATEPLYPLDESHEINAALTSRGVGDELEASAERSQEGSSRPPKFRLSQALLHHVRQGMSSSNQSSQVPTDTGFRGHSLVWRNLYFKRQGVQVLKGVTGYIAPGMVTALIGAPDSGTTSLLKVLAGRNVDGEVVGDLLVNGRPFDHTLSTKVGYIPKEDINIPCLTVRETLEFSFALRSKEGTPSQVRADRIDAALQLLGLAHVADTIVGDGNLVRGVSGGERRRVSLGVEAVVNRTILLADSPTNGLDSAAAYDVIKTARAMADTRLVSMMCSIRQPSPELFHLFDTCCLISRGSCIYFGPTTNVVTHFNQLGYTVPTTKSIPDFLEAMTFDASEFLDDSEREEQEGGNSTMAQAELRRARRPSQERISLAHAYRTSKLYEQLGIEIWKQIDEATLHEAIREELVEPVTREWHYIGDDEISEPEEPVNIVAFTARKVYRMMFENNQYVTGFWNQFKVCTVRQARITMRSPTSITKVGSKAFLGILLGTLFSRIGLDQEGANNRFGLVFLVASAVMMGNLSVIPQLFSERTMFYHQKGAGYFRGTVYYACVLIVEAPVMLTQALVLSLLVYPLCGLQGGIMSWNFVYFVATLLVLEFGSWSICLLGVMICPSVVVAQALVPTIMAVMLLFSGFLVPRNALPSGLVWLNRASLLSGPFKGLAINEVTGLVYSCDPGELIPQPDYPGFTLPPPLGFWGPAYQTCPLGSGTTSLMLYDLQSGEQDKWVLLADSLVYILGINALLIAVVALVNFSTDTSDAAVTAAKARHKNIKALKSRRETAQQLSRGTGQQHPVLAQEEVSHVGVAPPDDVGSVEFENLNYSVSVPGGEKQLLFDVSGYCKPRTLTSLMGSSGAGKSTLLDVLANKKTGGTFSADTLLVNALPRDRFLARKAGYVEQMDSHLPTITVREAIATSAALRLPPSVSAKEREARVDRVLDRLMLRAFEHQLVGSPGGTGALGGVSPEVRKKVTIAVELVFDPPLLFLDEPTTSLSAAEALAVMTTLKSACADKAVMCTIHQPSAEVFSLFDWILLLQTGGRVAFFGPLDKMADYFLRQGMGNCAPGQNPADFALECSRAKGPQGEEAWELYDRSDWKQQVLSQAPRFEEVPRLQSAPRYRSKFAASFTRQFRYLLVTQFRYYSRDTPLLLMRCITAAVFGLIIGALFFRLAHDQPGAKARIGLMFIACVYGGLSGVMSIPKVIDQRAVHYREYTSSMYRLPAYYLAVALAEIPFVVLQMSCFVAVFYPLTGLRGGSHLVLFCAVLYLTSVTCFAFSSLLAALAPNADTATVVNSLLNSVFTLFCGFLVPYKSIPALWRPAYYVSFFRYPLGVLVANELQDADFVCGEDGSEGAFPVYVGGTSASTPPLPFGAGMPRVKCALVGHDYEKLLADPECFRYYCPVIKGDALLKQFSFPMTTEDVTTNIAILAGMYVVIRLAGFLALKYVVYIKR